MGWGGGWGWDPLYLTKKHTALGFKVWGGGGGMSFDINGTALVDNGSCGPYLFNSNWSLCIKFSLFIFFIIRWGQCLLHPEASFPLGLCLLCWCFLFSHCSGMCRQTETFYRCSLSTSFSLCLSHVLLSGGPPLLAEEFHDYDVTTAQLEDPSMNQDIRGNERWSPKVTSS